MNINNAPEIFLWFLIYSFAGWAWETIITSIPQRRFVNRGFLNGPYCPIYGVGALLLIFITNPIEDPFLRFLVGGTMACALEYTTSLVLEKIFHARWWDYTIRYFNLNGRICLEGFILFGLFGVTMPYVHKYTSGLTGQLPAPVLNSVFSITLILFLADIIITNHALNKFNKILREYQKIFDKHRLGILEFIRRGKRVFEMRIGKTERIRNVLSFQQRRILDAFPRFRSTLYKDAFERIKSLSSENDDSDNPTTQKPPKSRSARKKARKKANAAARSKRRK